MLATARIGFVVVCAALATIVFMPLVAISVRLDWQSLRRLPVFWHKIIAWLLGLRIHVEGEMDTRRPLLIAANHVSWSDIVVLGSLEYVSFIAKSDMANWPFFGVIARLQRSVFVDREQRSRSRVQAGEVAQRLADGDVMVLFAEGTTADGNTILPFKSSLFGAAEMVVKTTGIADVTVQPVTIAYVGLHGMPMGRQHRKIAAWTGNQGIMPHIAAVMREGAIDVEVHYGESEILSDAIGRKRMSGLMEERVRGTLSTSLRGRIDKMETGSSRT